MSNSIMGVDRLPRNRSCALGKASSDQLLGGKLASYGYLHGQELDFFHRSLSFL